MSKLLQFYQKYAANDKIIIEITSEIWDNSRCSSYYFITSLKKRCKSIKFDFKKGQADQRKCTKKRKQTNWVLSNFTKYANFRI